MMVTPVLSRAGASLLHSLVISSQIASDREAEPLSPVGRPIGVLTLRAVAVLLLLTSCAGLDPATPPLAGPSPSRTGTVSKDGSREPFVPRADAEGNVAVLPLTFPDGSSVVLRYPSELRLAQSGVQPDVDFVWDGRWIGAFVFAHGGPYSEFLSGDRPLVVHRAGGSDVEEWPARQGLQGRAQNTERWLLYRLPSWTVHVPLNDHTPVADVIQALSITQTTEGFVTVHARAPAELPRGAGEGGGSQLAFGDGDPSADTVQGGRNLVVAPYSCNQPVREISLGGTFGSACLLDSLVVRVQVFRGTPAEKQFVKLLIDEVEAYDMRGA